MAAPSTAGQCPVAHSEVELSLKDLCPYTARQKPLTPQVRWYQRESAVFLTVEVTDCQDPQISVAEDRLFFHGTGGPELQSYELSMVLLHHISVETSKYCVRPRVVEFRLEKEVKEWWPRLLDTKDRHHWLRIDFQNWKDEDDQGEEKEPFEEPYQPVTTDWGKHIAANIAKGSSLCPIGQSVMGGAMGKDAGEGQAPEARTTSDGRIIPPTPQMQAASMTSLDIYGFDPSLPDSDDEPISDIEI